MQIFKLHTRLCTTAQIMEIMQLLIPFKQDSIKVCGCQTTQKNETKCFQLLFTIAPISSCLSKESCKIKDRTCFFFLSLMRTTTYGSVFVVMCYLCKKIAWKASDNDRTYFGFCNPLFITIYKESNYMQSFWRPTLFSTERKQITLQQLLKVLFT